ncbi:GNAT family protein [Mesobacillus jeotgali]|jgi:[ribosomal protein S5]-alanine N-acetyltransferase|uniref:GNAT family protein n=1 Tax=Mesobacillus jeotgali TaxID=129985 RepID=A0ABY9VAZ4_9BACI|nr:GNAT family protein [Mesobacillus jeotgali]WNF21072.1 GNAT family protein [Mesobacillus jeotgali]
MGFPVLETERLLLREIKAEDAQRLFINFSNPEVMKHYGSELMDDIEEARGLIHSFHIGYKEGKAIRWGLQLKNNNSLIGTVGFHAISTKNRRAEIGYELNQGYWGKGFAKEAILKVVEYGFEEMALKRIGAVVFLENKSSSELLLKLGFSKEGVLRDYMVQNGISYDTNVYSLLAHE